MNDKSILACHDLGKRFREADLDVDVFRHVNLTVKAKESVAIIGASGAGKSSLLHLLGGLDTPSSGTVNVMGQDLHAMSERQRCRLRNQYLGFVYQFHHLLPEFTALENVAMPLLLANCSLKEANERAKAMISQLGLAKRLQHKPAELSGGEKQRIAIARALVTEPACLLADEPTGNLDSHTAGHVFEQLMALNQALNTSLVIVTHDKTIAGKLSRCYQLRDGKLI